MKSILKFSIPIFIVICNFGCSSHCKIDNAFTPFTSKDQGSVFLYSSLPFRIEVPTTFHQEYFITAEYPKWMLLGSSKSNNVDSLNFEGVLVDTLTIERGHVLFFPRTDGEIVFRRNCRCPVLLRFKFRVIDPPIDIWTNQSIKSPSGHLLEDVLSIQKDTIKFYASIANQGFVNSLLVENITVVVHDGKKLKKIRTEGNILSTESVMLLRSSPRSSIVLLSFNFRGPSDASFEVKNKIYYVY